MLVDAITISVACTFLFSGVLLILCCTKRAGDIEEGEAATGALQSAQLHEAPESDAVAAVTEQEAPAKSKAEVTTVKFTCFECGLHEDVAKAEWALCTRKRCAPFAAESLKHVRNGKLGQYIYVRKLADGKMYVSACGECAAEVPEAERGECTVEFGELEEATYEASEESSGEADPAEVDCTGKVVITTTGLVRVPSEKVTKKVKSPRKTPRKTEKKEEAAAEKKVVSPRQKTKKAKKTCAECQEAISGKLLSFGQRHFHVKCVKCSKCEKGLYREGAKGATVRQLASTGAIVCDKCFDEELPTCGKCGEVIEGKLLTVFGHSLHEDCLKCEYCEKQLQPDGVYQKADQEGKPACAACAAG